MTGKSLRLLKDGADTISISILTVETQIEVVKKALLLALKGRRCFRRESRARNIFDETLLHMLARHNGKLKASGPRGDGIERILRIGTWP